MNYIVVVMAQTAQMSLFSTGVATVVVMATVFADPAAHAHHSGAQFDRSRTVAVEGTVLRIDWANPHVYILLEQTAENGNKVEWTIEAVGPGPLVRLGWARDTLVAGDVIAVTGNPGRGGSAKTLNLLSL